MSEPIKPPVLDVAQPQTLNDKVDPVVVATTVPEIVQPISTTALETAGVQPTHKLPTIEPGLQGYVARSVQPDQLLKVGSPVGLPDTDSGLAEMIKKEDEQVGNDSSDARNWTHILRGKVARVWRIRLPKLNLQSTKA